MKSLAAEFTPVRAKRAFEAVCERIREQLANGALSPGDRLPGDRQLAEQFGVSRSAVREALRSLQNAGVVAAQAGVHGGFFVRDGTPDGLTQAVRDHVALGKVPPGDITEARIELMTVALRLACERGTDADFDAIEADIANYAEAARSGQPLRDSTVITSFYHLVALATHNAAMVMLIDALSEIVRNLLAQIDPVPRPNVVQVRRKVLKHLRERDADKAAATLVRHLHALDDYIRERTAARAASISPPGG
ncbi:MAG: FadR/GntR family transcriptional regulator [Ramlibacter sp.]